MQNQIKVTEGKRLFRRKRSNDKEYDALNEANTYLLGMSQLNAELDVLSHRATHKESELLTETLAGQTKAIIDIKEQSVFVTKSPSEELDEALECLRIIADIDFKEDMTVQKSIESMVNLQIEKVDAVNDDDNLRDEFVNEITTLSKSLKEKKTTKGKFRKFFRRLVGKN